MANSKEEVAIKKDDMDLAGDDPDEEFNAELLKPKRRPGRPSVRDTSAKPLSVKEHAAEVRREYRANKRELDREEKLTKIMIEREKQKQNLRLGDEDEIQRKVDLEIERRIAAADAAEQEALEEEAAAREAEQAAAEKAERKAKEAAERKAEKAENARLRRQIKALETKHAKESLLKQKPIIEQPKPIEPEPEPEPVREPMMIRPRAPLWGQAREPSIAPTSNRIYI